MITVCIRYTIDPRKRGDFEQYARNSRQADPAVRGTTIGILLAHSNGRCQATGIRLTINFPSLADYEKYREALMRDPGALETSPSPIVRDAS